MSFIEAITIPKWGMTMTEGTIVQWNVNEGDAVARGQEILEIESTKVTNVLEATATGILRRIVIQEGDTAPIGALIGVIADEAATQEEIEAFIASYADRLGLSEEAENGAIAPRALAVDGGTVNILETGPESAETVVFVHGFGGDLSTWLFNQSAIAENFRTVAIDLPGHGASSPILGNDVLPKIISAIEEAVLAVAPGRVHLIGHSFGGAIAAAIGANQASRIGSVTLIAPIGLSKHMNRDFLLDFIAAERRRPLLNVLERLFADPSKITSDMVEGTLQFKRLEGVPEALSSIAETIADENGQLQSINAKLAEVACPVMLIWGDQDAIVPVPETTNLPANAQLRIIPGVGHMPQMEASSAVNEAILENIRRGR